MLLGTPNPTRLADRVTSMTPRPPGVMGRVAATFAKAKATISASGRVQWP